MKNLPEIFSGLGLSRPKLEQKLADLSQARVVVSAPSFSMGQELVVRVVQVPRLSQMCTCIGGCVVGRPS